MVVPTPSPIAEQELRTVDGQVYAYIVPAEELERLRSEAEELVRLRTELEAMRSQLAKAERQRNFYSDELAHVLKTFIPLPPSEEEVAKAVPNSEELAKLISELESR
jgi:hypothetical protein